jgi:hypothetical protein
MARSNAIVDEVQDLSPTIELRAAGAGQSAPPALAVTFAGGQRGLLDPNTHRSLVWADVLRSLHETSQPAYVEIDPETSYITEVLLPVRYRVVAIEPTAEGLQVELVISHARHELRRDNPDFDELRERLETALARGNYVLVTETLDEHSIIDVRVLDEFAEAEE